MNKAILGIQNEKNYTSILNKKEKFWDILPYNKNETYAIHITSKKHGEINGKKINCKADIFLASGNIPNNILKQKNYYLSEIDLDLFKLKPIKNSGISIKLPNSKYTIFKMSPNTFFKLFKNNILAAGASIYTSKNYDFNEKIINAWGINKKEFINFFSKKLNKKEIMLNNPILLEIIKTYCNKKIHDTILLDKTLKNLIFKGIGNFKEPFTAYWLIENDKLQKNYDIPFIVTTGSGRSSGKYTIILKPSKNK